MKNLKIVFILMYLLLPIYTYASDASDLKLVKKLNLIPGKKAIIQWERIFKSKRKMKKYGIDILTEDDKQKLKKYLISHAADSDQPTIAGM
jgi:ribosome biogenesis GTPase A